MKATTSRPEITVTADGRGVASHGGSRLLADLGAVTGLDRASADAVGGGRRRRSVHDRGRVLADLAVLLADGGETISDLGVLRNQPDLCGRVASTATAWRGLEGIDGAGLARLRTARAVTRERAWLARADLGGDIPVTRAGGRAWPGLVIDLDATLVTAHSDKELARPDFKGGYHPLLAFLDNTSEALAGILRPGNAGSVRHDECRQVIWPRCAGLEDVGVEGDPVDDGGDEARVGEDGSPFAERGVPDSFRTADPYRIFTGKDEFT